MINNFLKGDGEMKEKEKKEEKEGKNYSFPAIAYERGSRKYELIDNKTALLAIHTANKHQAMACCGD